ncbi:MerR family transcriptional regulator [Streptomyces sp. CB01249]|uniref:MerR family transcriptional regulator n=1 Tax=Streptomyces sp. CB01249 TaxID=1703929 RepID=UPI00093F287A|nr:MerR family transcriptional regulator [Streptomyces sp. CB01249]OKJ03880.1 MerR family transcriptional regulator [Streptomyces sp. CB01249]
MEWPTAEVVRMSGVTARTLRHYDAIGLLPPARTGAGGLRYYGEPQLLRLQQILVLRELGLGLGDIGRVLAEQVDAVEALRGHHRRLLTERDRLDTLATTVSRTIAELEQSGKDDAPMTINRPENLFEGVQPEQYQESLRDFPAHAERVARHVEGSSPEDIEAGQRERTARMIRLAELRAEGHAADSAPVQAEVDAHYRLLSALRPVTAEEHLAMGRSVVDNPDWRAAYEAIAPGLAAFQRDAIEAYTADRLG